MMSDANVRCSRGAVRISRTNLIIHDGVMDISSEAAKFIRILDIGKKSCNGALFFQRFQLSQDLL